jgi:hypothetical protein
MFGMFGIGPMEIVVVLVICAAMLGIPLTIVVLLVLLRGKNTTVQTGPSYEQLLEENERLQQEMASLKERNREPT